MWTALAASFLMGSAQAFSAGAGGCVGGAAAVGGSHLARETTLTGTLAEGGLSVYINNELKDISTPLSLAVAKPYSVHVNGTSEYKGILYRLESTLGLDVTGFVTPAADDPRTKIADACAAPATGLTHVNSDLKNNIPMFLNIESAGTYKVDVTIVISNNASLSEYYHSQFAVNANPETASPVTAAPALSPAPAPSMEGTPEPAAEPAAPTPKTSTTESPVSQIVATASPMAPTPDMVETESPVEEPASRAPAAGESESPVGGAPTARSSSFRYISSLRLAGSAFLVIFALVV
jgi:hypothetical protein